MRIALATDWFAPRRGGIESQLDELTRRLAAAGHDVTVLTSTPNAVGQPGVAVRPLRVLTLPGSQVAASPTLYRTLQRELRERFDVVHAHVSVVSPVGWLAALAAGAQSTPLVVTFHSVLRYKRHLLRLAAQFFGASRGRTVWSAVSALVARQVESAIPGVRVDALPNGVDLAFWGETRALRPVQMPVTLVAALRLHRKKRPHALIRAFAAGVRDARVDAQLVLVGEGPEKKSLERAIAAAEVPHGSTISLLDWRDAQELRSLYASATAFVLPSVREAFGIAALEARAAGLPVIAMTAAGSSEFLQHRSNALLCEDDLALRQAIATILSDRGLRDRLAGMDGTLDRYDWRNVIRAHERAYTRAMELAGGSSPLAA